MSIKIVGSDIIDDSRNIISSTFTNYAEVVNSLGSLSSGITTIRVADGNVVTATLPNGSLTFDFNSTQMSPGAFGFVLYLTNPSSGVPTITWPASINWQGGAVGVGTTTNSKTNVFSFITTNNGVNWYGNLSQTNL